MRNQAARFKYVTHKKETGKGTQLTILKIVAFNSGTTLESPGKRFKNVEIHAISQSS